jgi:hypothetical protein
VSSVKPRRISDIKPLFTNLAQTTHYQLSFGGLPYKLTSYLGRRGVDINFITNSAGLLCYNASLPTAAFSPKQVDSNFTGIQEKFAVTRIYNEISFDFYVDSNYKMIKFLESWMEFIASGSHNPPINDGNVEFGTVNQGRNNYFVRMQYPESYKCNFTKLLKFDRNYDKEIEYRFVGLWPIFMSPPQISYSSTSTPLSVTVSFSYDRYIAGKALGVNFYNGDATNIESNQTNTPTGPTPDRRLVPVRGQSGVVSYDANNDTRTTAEVNRRFYDSLGRPIIN